MPPSGINRISNGCLHNAVGFEDEVNRFRNEIESIVDEVRCLTALDMGADG